MRLTIFAADGLTGSRLFWAMIAISLAVGMATLDTAITNTVLPTIHRDLQASASGIIWVVTSYQLCMVAAILPLAALGDIIGHRKIFLTGLIIFSCASLACGLVESLSSLVIARALQGVGAAALMSANTALIRLIYPEKKLGRGLGLNALVIAFGVAAGPTIASIMLSFTSWHWLFLMNVPLGLLALIMAWKFLPNDSFRSDSAYDVLSALYCAGMFGLLVHGAAQYAQGATFLQTGIEWIMAGLLYYFLARRQIRTRVQILSLNLFRLPAFTLSALAAFCAFVVQGLAYVVLPFFFQHSLGLSEIQTGFFITPWPAVGAVMAPVAGYLSDRYSAGILGGIGLCCLAIGMGALTFLSAGTEKEFIVICMMICGFGFGLFLAPNQHLLMSSTPKQQSGAASGILGVARILGQAFGAVVVALCLRFSGVVSGPEIALWVGCACAALGALASMLRLARQPVS